MHEWYKRTGKDCTCSLLVCSHTQQQTASMPLHTMHMQVAKAQESVAGTEERVRAEAALERSRLAADYDAQIRSLTAEADRREREGGVRLAVIQVRDLIEWTE